MQSAELIATLTGGFTAALLLGYLTQRLGWSPIVGYLLAGVLVGPYTPGFVADRDLAEQLAEIGVILLMFGVGLHIHLKELKAVKWVAAAALLAGGAASALGLLVVRMAGWDWPSSIVLGLSLSVASTVVVTRVLADFGVLQSVTGRIAIGWLVMEDILMVFVMVVLPVAVGGAHLPYTGLATALGIAALKITVFVVLTLAIGARMIVWVLNQVARTQSRELFTLAVLVVALGISVGSAYYFSVSVALGAFLAGMIVGRSEFSARAGSEALPMRDAFAVLFFLSVGMLFNPMELMDHPWITLLCILIVLTVKPILAFLITSGLGYGSKTAFQVGLSLGQIGEFSFMLAALASQMGVFSDAAMNPIVATAMFTMTVNPFLLKLASPLEQFLKKQNSLWPLFNSKPLHIGDAGSPAPVIALTPRAVVVGFGPIGRRVAHLLKERGVEPTIVEMNLDTYHEVLRLGYRAIYGDARLHEVLLEAGVPRAGNLILSSSGSFDALEAIRQARELNPKIHVLARADFVSQSGPMRRAGADEVFSGEGEVAFALFDSVLRKLGATPEQLDEERTRARQELSA